MIPDPPPPPRAMPSLEAMCDPSSEWYDPPNWPHFTVAPKPPPVTVRPVAFFDTECFPNYWLLMLRPRGGSTYAFRLRAGESFDQATAARIQLLFDAYCVVSFNGIYYDVPMITAALSGYTAEQLKWLNDRIIPARIKGQPRPKGAKPWELGLPEWRPADHIDVMEVIPGKGGQKYKAGVIHYKTMRDLPYDPGHYVTEDERVVVDEYCGNDLGQLEALYDAVQSQLALRISLGARYGLDLRSKSDAQVAEAVLKRRCEMATGRKIYAPQTDYSYRFRFDVPDFISYSLPQLQHALTVVKNTVFTIGPAGNVPLPPELESLSITIGRSTYQLGIGGLHSQEKQLVLRSSAANQIRMPDVASYYPTLILNSGAWPDALGETFLAEYGGIKDERLACKDLAKRLRKAGDEVSDAYNEAATGDSGGKIMLNGTFGKTLAAYGVLRAPKMGIQTTLSGQLSILMLIEWMEHYGIPVWSANTDGIVIDCPRHLIATCDYLIAEWERRTGLTMETDDYEALYARDVNAYIAIKTPDDIKRKGEYAKANLIFKKAPDCEICADAVVEFLARGVPIEYTVAACRDITKFVTIQNVDGGGVKMHGEGPRKGARVMDMVGTLQAGGWVKEGRKWRKGDSLADAATAYAACFQPQRPEYLGKVVRWYYGTRSPGPIVYASNGNTVSLSYGAKPCMTLPDEFPEDVDYSWYVTKAHGMLKDLGLT